MTDTTAALAALHAHLDRHPDDWAARLVLADLLTDLGYEKDALCQRWMVRHRRRPENSGRKGWWMWHVGTPGLARLPDWLWKDCAARRHLYPIADARQSAEAALLAGLVAAGEI